MSQGPSDLRHASPRPYQQLSGSLRCWIDQRFTPGVSVTPKVADPVLVRRLKEDLRKIGGGFPRRQVEQIDIDMQDAPELRRANLLDDYAELHATAVALTPGHSAYGNRVGLPTRSRH